MNGRVIFSKDFLNKTQQPLTHKQLGELRVQKIIEAEKDGRLAKARNRTEVAELIGISKDRVAVANSWVYRQISLGYMTETLLQFDKNHRPEYEYHFYENKILKPKHTKTKNHGVKTPIVKPQPQPEVKPQPVVETVSQPVESAPAEITVPLNQDVLERGFSLTLNINFTINK